jgi:hypothetical protein
MIEAKFCEGLTDHQPVDCLRRLKEGGVLVFVAPASRISTPSDLGSPGSHRAGPAAVV